MFDFTLQQLILRFASILLAVAVHGYVQALVARLLGDPGPKYDKRLTLSPLAHLDALGTLGFLFFSLGWIKPITLEPDKFRKPRRGLVVVALASIAANLALALVLIWLRPLVFTTLTENAAFGALVFMNTAITLNIWFSVFNLVPIPPLTGFLLLVALAPRLETLKRYTGYGKLLLAVLVVTGVAAQLLSPLHQALTGLLMQVSFG